MSKKRIQPTATNSTANSTKAERTSSAAPSFWKTNRNVAILFTLLGFLLYSYSLSCEYVLDDQIVYTDNQFVKKGFGGIGDILKKETFVGYFGEQKDLVTGARYRPLSLITFAIEHQFFNQPMYDAYKSTPEKQVFRKDKFGKDLYLAPPAVGHFNNILLYILSTLLLFRVLSMLFPNDEEKPWYFTLPFIASLLFLLHPIHTEAIANIKGRDEILTFIGSFAALYYILRWQKQIGSANLLKAGAMFFLGLLSKENAMTFLAIIPLTLHFFTDATRKQIQTSFFVIFATFMVYFLIRFNVVGYVLSNGNVITDVMNNPFYGMTGGERMATVIYTLGLYIKLLFVPIDLTHDYYPYQIPIMNWGRWETLLSLATYVAMGLFALWGLRSKNYIAYCVAFYLATLSIVSNVPFSVGTFMNERFVYLSSVGFCMLLAYWATQTLPKWIPQNIQGVNLVGGVLVAVLALGYTVKTLTRVPVWKNALSLNSAAIVVSPNSARANLFMGTALFNDAKIKPEPERKELMYRGQAYVQKAVKIVPNYNSAIHMLSGLDAEVYAYDKNLDTLLAKFQTYMPFREKLTVENPATGEVFMDLYLKFLTSQQNAPKLAIFYRNIIPIFSEQKKDYKNAIRYLQSALQIAPQDPWFNEQMAKMKTLAPNAGGGGLPQPQQTPTQQMLQAPIKK
jgi:tetratricopeptide (TPR) repeat protein